MIPQQYFDSKYGMINNSLSLSRSMPLPRIHQLLSNQSQSHFNLYPHPYNNSNTHPCFRSEIDALKWKKIMTLCEDIQDMITCYLTFDHTEERRAMVTRLCEELAKLSNNLMCYNNIQSLSQKEAQSDIDMYRSSSPSSRGSSPIDVNDNQSTRINSMLPAAASSTTSAIQFSNDTSIINQSMMCHAPTPVRRNRKNRICGWCHTNESPEWRTGPVPNEFLCNACGLQYRKRLQLQQPARPSSSTPENDPNQQKKCSISSLLN